MRDALLVGNFASLEEFAKPRRAVRAEQRMGAANRCQRCTRIRMAGHGHNSYPSGRVRRYTFRLAGFAAAVTQHDADPPLDEAHQRPAGGCAGISR